MKKLLSIVLVFTLFLGACTQTQNKDKYVIGFSQCVSHNDWRTKMTKEIILAASNHSEIQIIVESADATDATQNEHIERLAQQGVDLLIISPNSYKGLTKTIDKYYKQGIPVILLDRKTNSENYTSYIGADNYQIGVQMGKQLLQQCSPKAGTTILELWGGKASSPAQGRHAGFREALAQVDSFNFVDVYGEWHPDTAVHRLKETGALNKKIDIVYAHNDLMGLAAYQLWKNSNRPMPKFISIDGLSHEGLAAVKDNKLDATIIYPTGGAEAVEAALKLLKGQTVARKIELETIVVNKGNVKGIKAQADYIKKQQDFVELKNFTIDQNKKQISQQRMALAALIGVVLLIVSLLLWVYRSQKKIAAQAQQLKLYNAELIDSKAEIEQQAEELLSINENLEERNNLVQHQNEYIMSGIKYAKTIQDSILPLQNEMQQVLDSFTLFMPKDVVSGDFYWFFDAKGQTVTQTEIAVFAVVDCTGHGVPGAFMSMIGNRVLSNIVKENQIWDPGVILAMMDERVFQTLKQNETMNDDGMDVCLLVVEKQEDGKVSVEFAGAKRPLFHKKADSEDVEIIRGSRRSIGGKRSLTKTVKFDTVSIDVQPNDMLYLTSDGYIDQNGEKNTQRFGSPQFIQLLQSIAPLSMEEQKEKLKNTILDYMGKEKQRDDISVMGIRL